MSRGDRTAPEPGADFAASRASKRAHPGNSAVEQGSRHAARTGDQPRGVPSPAASSARQPQAAPARRAIRPAAPARPRRTGSVRWAICGSASAEASRGAESMTPRRTRANAQLLASSRGSGLRGRAGLPGVPRLSAAGCRGRSHPRSRRVVPRRPVPPIAIRCQREEVVSRDSADSSAETPGALSLHDSVSDHADARAAHGRS